MMEKLFAGYMNERLDMYLAMLRFVLHTEEK